MQPNLRHILLIDDDVDFCQSLKDMFDGSNYHLNVTQDAHEGLRFALTATQLDLILLDIDMPELSGLEVLKQLKHTHAAKLPVIMLTAHSDIESVQKAIQLGAEGYLLKPFRLHYFVDTIKRLFKDEMIILPPTTSTPTQTTGQEPPKTHHIVLVDDQAQMHFLIQEILEKSICNVISCYNGREAIKHIEHNQPDLVLLDIYLPDMDSVDVLQKIRNIAPDLPVLVLVSDSHSEKLAQVRQLNIQGYVLRTFKYHSIISQLEKEIGVELFPERI